MRHIMIDLETLSLQPNAAIVAIGAVEMDLENLTLGSEFYCAIDAQSCQQFGLHVDAGTAIWWMQQSDEARKEITDNPDTWVLQSALARFGMWVAPTMEEDEINSVRIWAGGAAGDNVWLRQAFQAVHVAAPWKYYNDRCYRTLRAMFKDVPFVPPVVRHHALEDAKAQARHLLNVKLAHNLYLT